MLRTRLLTCFGLVACQLFHSGIGDELAAPATEFLTVFGFDGATRAVIVSLVSARASCHWVPRHIVPRGVENYITFALHFSGAVPSHSKKTRSEASTLSVGGATDAPLTLHLAGEPLLPSAETQMTRAGRDKRSWAG